MTKTTCEMSSSARGGDISSSQSQSQSSSDVISCSTRVEHTPTNADSCLTNVEHAPTNTNSTSDPGFESESDFNHQRPKFEPKKKVHFSQEGMENDTQVNLQPTSNTTTSNVQVRNIDYSYQKLNTRMFISRKYQSAMCELLGATADISKSLDHTVLSSACYVCDPRLKVLVHEVESLETNKQLSQNITFVPSDGFMPPHWRYDQLFNGKIDYLPSGEFEAKKRTWRLLERLNRDDDAVPRCASEKLQELYCEKGLSWLTGYKFSTFSNSKKVAPPSRRLQ